MGAADILGLLTKRGLTLRPRPDGNLEVSPRRLLTDETRRLILDHKAELVAALVADALLDPRAEITVISTTAELRRLVNEVADAHGFSPQDGTEALEVALRDPDRNRALTCCRALAADALPDPRSEARRQRVVEMLDAHPTARYALVTDMDADPEAVILTLAIRGQATCELRIPRDRYDPFLLLDLIERHGGTVH